MKKKGKNIIFLIILIFIFTIFFLVLLKSNIIKETKNDKKRAEEYYTSGWYFINSDEDNNKVSIKLENSSGMSKIIYPNNSNELNCNMKTAIGLEYKINDINNDTFLVTNSRNEQSNLRLKKDSNITITELTNYSYPIITNNEIIAGKEIKLTSSSNKQIYYSMDNGKTWEKYEKQFFITKDVLLMAREELEANTIVKVEQKSIIMNYAPDALPTVCYDNDFSTEISFTYKNYKIYINPEMYGKTILFTGYHTHVYGGWPDKRVRIDFYNENNEIIRNIINANLPKNYNNLPITIPENAKYIQFTATAQYALYVVEVMVK